MFSEYEREWEGQMIWSRGVTICSRSHRQLGRQCALHNPHESLYVKHEIPEAGRYKP